MKRIGSRWRVGALAALVAVGCPGVGAAWGQSASGPGGAASPALTPAQESEAQRLYSDAVDAQKAGDFEQARKLFKKAFELKKHWKIAANLGRVEVKVGEFGSAVDHLEFFLREARPEDIPPEDRVKAQGLLDEAVSKSARLDVIVDVQGAEVLVDGSVVGRSPLFDGRVYVAPGKHEVTVRKEGYRSSPTKEAVDVAAGGRSRRMIFELKADPAGSWRGRMGGADAPGGVGGPQRRGDDGGGKGADSSTGNEPPWRAPIVAGLGVLGAISLGAGVGFTLASNGKSTDAVDVKTYLRTSTPTGSTICDLVMYPGNREQCDKIREARIAQDSFRNVAIAGYIVGGAAVLGAVVVAALPNRKSGRLGDQTSLRFAPSVGSTGAGVAVSGSF